MMPDKDTAPTPRLYLVTPDIGGADDFAPTLAKAIEGSDVAAVLLRLAPGDDRTLTDIIKRVGPVVQDREIAFLVDGHVRLAMRGNADGAHLRGVEALSEALESLKPDRIAGAGGLASRHDAMIAAESGADYVMFGDPDRAANVPFAAVLDRVTWWTEVFQTPCVGFASNAQELAAIARAGAEFVAIDYVWSDPRGPLAAVSEASRQLAATAVPS